MTNLDSAKYVLTTTRAVRKRLDLARPVSREVIEDCLEIALQAPNGSNLNTWRWVLVDDRNTIARIGKLYDRALGDFIESLGDATGENYQGAHIPGFERISDSVDHLRRHMGDVPMIVIPLMAGRTENLSAFFQASMWGSVLPAVWNFCLALRTRGLGTAWTTAHLHREAEVADILGIPPAYTQVGLFPVAYTKGTDFKPGWRTPLRDVAHWNRFGPDPQT